jgi:hypothetical protein
MEWLRGVWRDPRTQEVVRQVLVALLLALLSVLGYDRAVAQPRAAAQLEALEGRFDACLLEAR